MHGGACTYSGSAGTNTFSLTLQSCTGAKNTNIKCNDTDRRDIELVGDVFTGTVFANSLGGTEAQTWNTFVSGTATATEPMVVNTAFDLRR